MYCLKCSVEHDGLFGSGKFCSRACANSRTFSKETIEKKRNSSKTSEKVAAANEKQKQLKINKKCPVCDCEFNVHESLKDKIYCSRKCYNNDKNCEHRKKPAGGYREGSGHSKSGYYKDMWCGSTYELVFLIYSLDHNINIQRCNETFKYLYENAEHVYYPDFVVDGVIYEIKGFHTDVVDIKAKSVGGRPYKLLYKDDIKHCFDYVSSQYGTTVYEKLYDKYDFKFTYICEQCSNEIQTNIERYSKNKFCSKTCSGKHRQSQRYNH